MSNYIVGIDGELYHHGIKGMKWGVRRYQNKDGSLTEAGKKRLSDNNIRTSENLDSKTIPKGTKMYRVTPYEQDGSPSASKYVTYLDTDRNMYRGGTIVKSYISTDERKPDVYEHELELKTDVRIPSLDTVRQVEKRVLEDANRRQEVAEAWVKSHMILDGSTVDDVKLMSDTVKKYDLSSQESRKKAYKDLTNKYGLDRGDYLYYSAKNIADAKSWIDTNDSLIVEESLGMAIGTKNSIIKELKKLGYNAMYDNASIGVGSSGSYNKNQEAIEPLIIFDSKSTLKELSVTKVDTQAQAKAREEYNKWLDERNKTLKKF